MRGVPCRGQGERSRERYLLCGTFAVGRYLWSHLFRKREGAFTRRGEGGGAGRAVLMGFRNDVVIRRRSEEAWRGINAIGGGRGASEARDSSEEEARNGRFYKRRLQRPRLLLRANWPGCNGSQTIQSLCFSSSAKRLWVA